MSVTTFRSVRWKPLPIPADATRIFCDAFGAEMPAEWTPATFSLRRTKHGVEMWIHLAWFGWNLSIQDDHWPRTFNEAREYIRWWAARYGQTIAERPRKPRVTDGLTKEQRADLRAGVVREEWLRSDQPLLAAEAMVRCQHAGGFCSEDGFCHLGGCDLIMDAPNLSIWLGCECIDAP